MLVCRSLGVNQLNFFLSLATLWMYMLILYQQQFEWLFLLLIEAVSFFHPSFYVILRWHEINGWILHDLYTTCFAVLNHWAWGIAQPDSTKEYILSLIVPDSDQSRSYNDFFLPLLISSLKYRRMSSSSDLLIDWLHKFKIKTGWIHQTLLNSKLKTQKYFIDHFYMKILCLTSIPW